MSWSARKKKEGIFCTVYFVRRRFFKICALSQCIVYLNTISEYRYFYISKNMTLYTFLLVFKIAKSLQCIVKSDLNMENLNMNSDKTDLILHNI